MVPSLKATDRDAAVRELVETLVAADRLPSEATEGILDALAERERQGSTGFGKGIAVPHAKHPQVTEMMAAIGRSDGGINFNSLDGKPVRVVVLLLSPPDRSREHLDAMQTIFKVLQQDLFRRDLFNATSREAMVDLMRQADGQTP